jgi:hypothetical protein
MDEPTKPLDKEKNVVANAFFQPFRTMGVLEQFNDKVQAFNNPKKPYTLCHCGIVSMPTKEPNQCEKCRFYNAPKGLMEPIVFQEKYHVDDYEVNHEALLLKVWVGVKRDVDGKILHGYFKFLKSNEVEIVRNRFPPYYTITKTSYFDGCEIFPMPMNCQNPNNFAQCPNFIPHPMDAFRLYFFRDPQRKYAIHIDFMAKNLRTNYVVNDNEEHLQIILDHNLSDVVQSESGSHDDHLTE